MATPIELFDYSLSKELIAQNSVEPRDSSRLMILDRDTGAIEHKHFYDIGSELRAGDVLVLNDSKVFRARLTGDFEVFLLRTRSGNTWLTMARPCRKAHIGEIVNLGGMTGKILEKHDDGVVLIEFDREPEAVIEFANTHGDIPVPPYIANQPRTLEQYQTVYARNIGSVAAPTAGFHFTQRLIGELKQKGVQFEFVTLHVGLGTFRPMRTQTLEEHEMHSEFISIDDGTADRINTAKQEGRRIIAVGTTTVRTLEGITDVKGFLSAFVGDVNLFIKPGFNFKIIDGLITNFHLPKSTLLVLVSVFAGRDSVIQAYNEAITKGYRFYSFGDAMFIK